MSEEVKSTPVAEETAGKAEFGGYADAVTQDQFERYTPAVHKIGRITMGIAFILAFLPVLYLCFVKGYNAGGAAYGQITVVVASIGIGMWLTEPLSYWPVLGSAGTYIAYLSGNVGGMRFPVALNLQTTFKTEITSPRGQIVTVVGIVASVFANLAILLVIVLLGNVILSMLPENVLAAFTYVSTAMMGSMFLLRFQGKGGFLHNFLKNLPTILIAVAAYFLCAAVPALAEYGMLVAVVACILFNYIKWKFFDLKKADAAQ